MHNAVNQNYPIEHVQTVGTIKDALSFQFSQIRPPKLMKIALDVLGGDNAPLSTIEGAFSYLNDQVDSAAELILVGEKTQIESKTLPKKFKQIESNLILTQTKKFKQK